MRLRRIVTFASQAGFASLVLVCVAAAADPAFAPGGGLPVGSNPVSFVLADVNGDSRPDLAVANQGSDDLTVLLGDGAGGFSAAPGSPVPLGDGPYGVAAADLNDDGRADLAVANNRSNDVTVLLGDGAGGFSAAPDAPVDLAGSPEDVAAADLNGDGNVDLALPIQQNGWRAAVLLGDGTGRFAPASGSPFAVGGTSGGAVIAIADLNGDGKHDLAVGRSESRVVAILPGDGAGRFGAAATVAAGYGPSSLAVADLNTDRNPDLVVGTRYSDGGGSQNKLTVMLGNGAGGFRRAAGSPLPVPGIPLSLAVTDLNADGKPDIAAAANYGPVDSISVLLGSGTGTFRPAVDSPFPVPSLSEIAAADLNGDGGPDFVVAGTEGVRVVFRTRSVPAIARGRNLRGRPNPSFTTSGLITKLAADGVRVAAKTTARGSCGRVVVWTAPGRTSKTIPTKNPGCGSIVCTRGSGCVDELALGAGQVAWIARAGGNSLELRVIAAKLSGGAPRELELAVNQAGAAGDPAGSWVGHLLGGGSVLAYNGWRLVCDAPEAYACGYRDPLLRRTAERLVRVSAGRRLVVKRGAGSFALRAVGGGRMAVEADGEVTVLAASGARLAAIPASPANPPRAIALSATRLAILRTFTLDLYNPVTGAAVSSVELGPAAALQLVGVNSRLALFRGPRRVVLVRLRDGKPIALPLTASRAASIVDVRLTEAGLFYAYNVHRPAKRGKIVFEPSARLLARF